MATVSAFDDGLPAPHAEVTFANGEKVSLLLERDGLTIAKTATGTMLYRADPATVAGLCAALTRAPMDGSPLQLLVAVVAQLGSADDVAKAFRQAGAAVAG